MHVSIAAKTWALLLVVSAKALPNARAIVPSERIAETLHARDFSSSNWCGMVKNVSATSVVSTWKVPSVSVPQGKSVSDQYWFYQWVGIDGDTRQCEALLQGGTGQTITNGVIKSFFWYQFPPDMVYSSIVYDPPVTIGDTVRVTAVANSATSGTIYFENISTGGYQYYHVNSTTPLCYTTVEWIAEDPGDHAPFPDFSNFDFTQSSAKMSNGQAVDASASEQWFLDQPNAKCHARLASGSTVSIFQGYP
ncbi:hypothetical protein QQS21_006295 [Conoideocrella luteorostrata]|uniref:Concanavalin A-like lectin/glucanase n=1 Tax=Conoideocrella luteorostrata TaxID=1105319 RepID=A0AAJ0CMU9_9HYPO|nr:hypothetical protein QQS21_006295 [Conoideocrella luteorostrata]